MNKTLLALFIASICIFAVSAKAELLINTGFENGGTPPPAAWQEGWTPTGWFKWVGTTGGWASWKSMSRQSLSYTARTGDKFYAIGGWANSDHGNIGQVVKVNPGEVFNFSVWARTETWGTPQGYILVQWFDSAGVQTGTDEFYQIISDQVTAWTQYSYTTTAAPSNAATANFQVEGDVSGTVMVDDASVKLRYAANDPVPDINVSVPPTTTQLHWTRPAPRSTGTVTVDVWFGTSIAGMTKVVNNQAVDSWTISPALGSATYYWRVDCHDGSYLTTGRQWQFFTNTAPVVNAGPKQNLWLASGTAAATMKAVVTDDNLPNPPATVTYAWSVDSGPASVSFSPSANVLNPTATFTTAGDYILRLTANDSQFSNAGTVKIRVFAPGTTGIIAEYRLNETSGITATDSVGGHNGKLQNAPTWLPTGGKVGGALQLTSVSSQDVNCGGGIADHNSPSWADLRDEITISAWIKLPTTGWPAGNNPWTAIVTKGDSSWRLTRNANTDTVYFYCNGLADYGREVIGLTSVADNQWHFIAGVYDGANIAMYIDGILQHSYPSSGLISFNNSDVIIGNNAESVDNRYFNGTIDQVRIHNIGLPQSMIRQEYIADGGTTICAENLPGDINKDCYVDFKDFSALADNWLKCNDITKGYCQ